MKEEGLAVRGSFGDVGRQQRASKVFVEKMFWATGLPYLNERLPQ